jgi:RND family efflux transporter MFP subunit
MSNPARRFAIRLRWKLAAALVVGVVACINVGCHRSQDVAAPSTDATEKGKPEDPVVRPQRKTVRHPIEQPGFNIEAFQETPIYARISGYVKMWRKDRDIGADVKKGELLAELDVPEMVVAVEQKKAAVALAEAQVSQANAALLTAKAQVARTKSQAERLKRVGRGGALDRESVEEARLGYEAAEANLEKANADVKAAEAQVKVAKADHQYAETMLAYARIAAPFDGVVYRRNVSTGDFVEPAAAGAKGQPLYVVRQNDPVRVVVNVPGAEAAWIKDGDPVSFRLQGAGGEFFRGTVTRNARSLDPQARTLRTEIQVANPKNTLLPGMYVQATITVRHGNVWTLPASAVLTEGDQTYCYRVEDDKAVRTSLQVGLRGGSLVEVVKKLTNAQSGDQEPRWEDFTGDEEILRQALGVSAGQHISRPKAGK